LDEFKADLNKARRGKPLGTDKDGKPKRNVTPEV
jgi:DNA topoisomerase I